MGIESIGTGLKTVLDGISKLRVYAPNQLPDSVNQLPAALILPGEASYDQDFSADYDYMLRVVIIIAKQDSPSAFNKILDYIEPTGDYSVLATVQASPTLGDTCAAAVVKRNLGVGATNWGGINYLSTEFEVTILA